MGNSEESGVATADASGSGDVAADVTTSGAVREVCVVQTHKMTVAFTGGVDDKERTSRTTRQGLPDNQTWDH